jgi:hypothetical protein
MTIAISALLALIALIGAWIALQQMLIARARLNFDLFDRRFAVYSATREYIRAMLQHRGGTQEDAVKWWAVAMSAPFLFEDPVVPSLIKEVSDRGSKMRAQVGDKPIYESEAHVEEYNEHYMWFCRTFDDLERRFQKDMNLFQLNPFSVKRLFSRFWIWPKGAR